MIEITVKYRVNLFEDNEAALEHCQDIGIERSLLAYIRWLANEEGLLGIVEDDYEIMDASPA